MGRFLDTIESAPPTAVVDVFAAELSHWLDADHVRFLITDLSGQALVPLGKASASDFRRFGKPRSLSLDTHGAHRRALVTQRVQVSVGNGATTFLAPVTARGDTIGVLEVSVGYADAGHLSDIVTAAAHALAYVITTERRHTDLYEWGTRSNPVSLAGEIQRRLLPSSYTCEAGPFTVSAWLEPAHNVGGDTFDYALDGNRLYVSLTDAMGHETDAAMLATLTIGALRNGRRLGQPLDEIATRASEAIFGERHGNGFVTGQVATLDLATGVISLVNAGHPLPVVARDGRAMTFDLVADVPFGVLPAPAYRVQRFRLRSGDRVVFVTDGMLECDAGPFDVADRIIATRHLHPRRALQTLMTEFMDMAGEDLHDDAAVMCVDWYGPGHVRRASGGELQEILR
ncbi:MAG TPA: PP2C family protein-serine/threonine phosphatase [Jatrophihabitans sp.]